MDPLVNVDGIFSSYHLIDGRASLLFLTTFLCGSHLSKAEKHPYMHQTQTHLFPCHLPSSDPHKPHHSYVQKLNFKLNSSPGSQQLQILYSNFPASQMLYFHLPDRNMKQI